MARSSNVAANIPLTNQTDPRKFPDYEYVDYPKMMTRYATPDDIKEWEDKNKRIDPQSNVVYFPGGRPRLGSPIPFYDTDSGEPVIVHDEAEEEAFREANKGVIDSAASPKDAAEKDAELARLRAKVAAYERKEGTDDETPKNALESAVKKPEPGLPKPLPKATPKAK